MVWSATARALLMAVMSTAGFLALPAEPAAAAATPTSHRPAPPPGSLIVAFADNQLTYCSLICPHLVDFVVDVPQALLQAPGVYDSARTNGHSVERAAGIALATATGPARSAMTGIIDNDLNLVLPRAQNALEVAVVEMLDVAGVAQSGATPEAVGARFDDGRGHILDALTAPIVPNPPQLAAATTPPQRAALDAIDAGSAVLFQAPEILMTGATESADVAASELAGSGEVDRARAAGLTRFGEFLEAAGAVIDGAH